MMRLVLFLGSLLLLTACGTKGPLIMPPKPTATSFAPATPVAAFDDSTAPGAAR